MIVCNKCRGKVQSFVGKNTTVNKCSKCGEEYSAKELSTLIFRAEKEEKKEKE